MVLNITKYIAEEIKSNNTYLDALAVNTIKLKNGEQVNFIGQEKTNYSVNDIIGIGGYLRIDPNITYSKPKKLSSCAPDYVGTANCKLVVYAINQDKYPDPYKLENKLNSDLMRMSFAGYTGVESDVKILVKSSNLNNIDNFLAEVGRDYSIPAESVIVAINFSLSWSFKKEDCNNCDIWEDITCQLV